MKKRNLLVLGGTSICGALLFAQTLPPDHPSRPGGGIGFVDHSRADIATRTFSLQGKNYRSFITWEEAALGRAWDPSTPLPISLDQAEEIARKELAKLVSDEVRWQFAELTIGRFRAPTTNGENWYFALTMKPALALGEVNSDFFTLLMNSSGAPGRIGSTAGKTPQRLGR